MGLTLHVYKSGLGDCSNGGISGHASEVVCVNIDGPSEPDENRPAVLLVRGAHPGIARCIPAARPTGGGDWWVPRASMSGGRGIGPMMGGCYVATSDSRFSKKVEEITGSRFYGAVALHDRFETPKQYASND